MKSTCAVPEPLVDCPTVTLPPVVLEEVMVKDLTVKFTKALVSNALTMPVESGGSIVLDKVRVITGGKRASVVCRA